MQRKHALIIIVYIVHGIFLQGANERLDETELQRKSKETSK